MPCGTCDMCVYRATGTMPDSGHRFGGLKLNADCQTPGDIMRIIPSDWKISFSAIPTTEDREDYKAGVAAEREACAKLVEEQQCDGFSYIDKALVSVARMIRERSK